MVGFFDNTKAEEEEEYIPAKTFIKCPKCKEIFVSRSFNKERPADMCECGNIIIGIHMLEHSKYTHFVTVEWEDAPPNIYEELKDDRSMELVDA